MNEPSVCKYHMVSVAVLVKGCCVRMQIEMSVSGFTLNPHPLEASHHRLTRGCDNWDVIEGVMNRCVMSRIKDVVHLCLRYCWELGKPLRIMQLVYCYLWKNSLSEHLLLCLVHVTYHCSLIYIINKLCFQYGNISFSFLLSQLHTHY